MQRERKMKLNKHYSELNESYLFSTIAHKVAAYQKVNPDKDIIRLGIGDVTLPLAKSVTDAMLKAVEEQGKKETFHGYIPSEQGYEFLRSAIQKYYAGHGVELDMAEIFVSDGAKSDLGNLLDLFDVDNTVLVPDPVYPVYVDDNVMAGRKILYMSASAENNFLPMPDDNVHADIVYLCSPNNPTGALMSKELLGSIVEIARGVGAYILCDEVYRHLTQEDEWCESIVDFYEKGISVSSMSKVFSLAGLRMGWIATHDEAARKAFLSHRDYNLISCGMFDDAIASIALRHSDVMLKRNQRIVRENLAILDDWIKENPHFFYTKPKAGTTALVYYDFDIPSYEFCKRMYHETGAFVTPGDCFEQPHSMRVGYACDVNTLRDGLAAVTKFAATL